MTIWLYVKNACVQTILISILPSIHIPIVTNNTDFVHKMF